MEYLIYITLSFTGLYCALFLAQKFLQRGHNQPAAIEPHDSTTNEALHDFVCIKCRGGKTIVVSNGVVLKWQSKTKYTDFQINIEDDQHSV